MVDADALAGRWADGPLAAWAPLLERQVAEGLSPA
ncbi:MAG TPA: tRNA 5-methoxyuridine(34)/uridine 5-oxyacetic acid(34) synthase CmoB, partial [Halieaceae bacterium]|nr:tRNA 5-methoxyuridine(34)/uridine 5-oxyacetic acid(34) synthase CmoB [Halieaceae bacterium]